MSSRTCWISGWSGKRFKLATVTATLALGVLKTYRSPTLSKALARSLGQGPLRCSSSSASRRRRSAWSALRCSRSYRCSSVSPMTAGSSLLTLSTMLPRLGGNLGIRGKPRGYGNGSRSYSSSRCSTSVWTERVDLVLESPSSGSV
jgi:hypothetical protein